MVSKMLSGWAKNLIRPSIPQTPMQIYARGGLIWFNACIAIGSTLSISSSEKIQLSSLSYVAGACTIATVFGMKLFLFIPSIHISYILVKNGFATFYRCTGLELWLGPIDENITMNTNHDAKDEFDEYMEDDDDVDNWSQTHPMRISREALWDKILAQRVNKSV